MSNHSDEVESILALCLQHTDVLLEWDVRVPPQPKELCKLLHWLKCVSNPHSGRGRGLLSSGSGCSEMHDFALVGRKPETIPCRPFLYGIYCLLLLSLYGVQRAPTKTDCQVSNKECSEDVPGNTSGQLINLQSKTCHSQDTTSWNTFLWVEFIREGCPNSD